jgi:hypothetical protein
MNVGNILKLSNNRIEWSQGGWDFYISAERNTTRNTCTVYLLRSDNYHIVCNDVPEWMTIEEVVEIAFKSDSLFYKELAKL